MEDTHPGGVLGTLQGPSKPRLGMQETPLKENAFYIGPIRLHLCFHLPGSPLPEGRVTASGKPSQVGSVLNLKTLPL